MPQHDDHDDLAGLDFYDSDESGAGEHGDEDPLDFSGADDDGGEMAAIDAVDEFAPAEPEEAEEAEAELVALDSQDEPVDEKEEAGFPLFSVTNPAGTVSVSTFMGGTIRQVDLTDVSSMTEDQLTEEILALAELAKQKGQAAQRQYLSEAFEALGVDDGEAISELLGDGLDLPSAQQADKAQTEVFATRYKAVSG